MLNYLQVERTNYKLARSGEKWCFVEIFRDFLKISSILRCNMFRGATAVNLDSKGRVAIPTRYRAEILEKNQGQMVCTVDIRQSCLLLYPLDEWEKSNKTSRTF